MDDFHKNKKEKKKQVCKVAQVTIDDLFLPPEKN